MALSSGRAGFTPELTLAYDSGRGNGPFGLGWSLRLASISRKTDRGLPRYDDGAEADTFILADAEDLVPTPDQASDQDGEFDIQRYRPRIEGAFARIERWARRADGDTHWRTTSRDNVLSVYGLDHNSRIADPDDPTRVFSWLLSGRYDDRGNAERYEYKADDTVGVDRTRAHERHRATQGTVDPAANRYLKRIRYGNRRPFLGPDGNRPRTITADMTADARWMFGVVLDYGDHDPDAPTPDDDDPWPSRPDPFSSYRPGFEVRTYRLCRRILLFHHFPHEADVGDNCLVSSTDLRYMAGDARRGSLLAAVTHRGYRRRAGGGYTQRPLPAVEFDYTTGPLGHAIHPVEPTGAHLPPGAEGAGEWVDLDGEGLAGLLTRNPGEWAYRRNESPVTGRAGLAARQPLTAVPTTDDGRARLVDLAGDGRLDVVTLEPPISGFHERDGDTWAPFRPFRTTPGIDWDDTALTLVDLTGDGHTDVLITGDTGPTWYPSHGEDGFGPARHVAAPAGTDPLPRRLGPDDIGLVALADLSGDGLTDVVRIRNGEVVYWPNLGYGRFGPKVTMDDAPWFDRPDDFDPRRLRLTDIDGTGPTDLVYLGTRTTQAWFNLCGNAWGPAQPLPSLPAADPTTTVVATDLLGNGTSCLVWASPLPGNATTGWRYLPLLPDGKPHLLTGVRNNLGAETHITYTPSTAAYLRDRRDGHPWPTRLPFPVHVVDRIEVLDHISRNRFVTRYAYHDGYFDGAEREFRGFGFVEQWDTEQLPAVTGAAEPPDQEADVPPLHTRTWFHTGAPTTPRLTGTYHDPGGPPPVTAATLPAGLTLDEQRDAHRALKGSMLRQEVYALDGHHEPGHPHGHPYTVLEQGHAVTRLQPHQDSRPAVFLAHVAEAVHHHYERNPADPRVAHTLTLEVDQYGNVLKSAEVGYGRRRTVLAPDPRGALRPVPNPGLAEVAPDDQGPQLATLLRYTERRVTNPVDDDAGNHRAPLPYDTRSYELTGYAATGPDGRFRAADLVEPDPGDPTGQRQRHLVDTEVDHDDRPGPGRCRRLLDHNRTSYRSDDLARLLPLGQLHPRALLGEAYRLAFTPRLLSRTYQRPPVSTGGTPEDLLGDPATTLPVAVDGTAGDRGGYVDSRTLRNRGQFPTGTDHPAFGRSDGDGHWWVPSGRVHLAPTGDDPGELAHARQHFFLPHRYRDPFGHDTVVRYDDHDLLLVETRDPLGGLVTVGDRPAPGDTTPRPSGNDYRVLQPRLVIDQNRNRIAVAHDALGMVVATAVMGKAGEAIGDSLNGLAPDLEPAAVEAFHDADDPHRDAPRLLGDATTRVVYGLHRFADTHRAHPDDPGSWQPAYAAVLAREDHARPATGGPGPPRVQVSFTYADGFGREAQRKLAAEPDPDATGDATTRRRWVANGWTVFNNKGKPVRQYEPFFSHPPARGHHFEFGVRAGVSPIVFYDPADRVVATLHPDRTYDKVVIGAWRQRTYDRNDTAAPHGTQTGDPRTDPNIAGHVAAALRSLPDDWQTWHEQRIGGALGPHERRAAADTARHADTPSTAHLDSLGRPYLTVAHIGRRPDGTDRLAPTRFDLDIAGNQRQVSDTVEDATGTPRRRTLIRTDVDLLGNRLHHAHLDAGQRWVLPDAQGRNVRAWDSRGHTIHTYYDPLRRPLRTLARHRDDPEVLLERIAYGESHPDADARNLRGKPYLHLDQAGAVTSEQHDNRGNLTRSTRRLARTYDTDVDWTLVDAALPAPGQPLDLEAVEAALEPLLEGDTYTQRSTYDALNRATQLVAPHATSGPVHVVQPRYNDANLLEAVDTWLDLGTEPDRLLDPATASLHPVVAVDYDARGQRRRIDHGTSDGRIVRTRYAYDPTTFRLAHLYTRRGIPGTAGGDATFTDDCDNPRPPPATTAAPDAPPAGVPCGLQSLRYTYDPAGNVTHTHDDAQPTLFFRNGRVDAAADYSYDALYRLETATGREHVGQAGADARPHSPDDAARSRLPHPNDAAALTRYVEHYTYDLAGNLLTTTHRRADRSQPDWTRTHTYDRPSLLQPDRPGNRLGPTGGGPAGHDAHGNVTALPHLQEMRWDTADRLRMTRRQATSGDTAGERTWYTYDANGQRTRKVTETADGQLLTERIYLGGTEVHRRHGVDPLERHTLHVMDDDKRIALVEVRTAGADDGLPPRLVRHQLGNHIGSVSLELDDLARIISYEEYSPYGATTYQGVRSPAEAPKRYRYTAKERDHESGLYYAGARYYAPWLGRWISCDPLLFRDVRHPYEYVRGNPLRYTDPRGTDDKQPRPTGGYTMPPNRGDLGTLIHDIVLKTLQLRLAILGVSSAIETKTRQDGSKNTATTHTGRVDLALLLPDARQPGAVHAQLYELKPRNPEKYQDYVSEVDHYTEHFPHTIAGTPVTEARIGTGLAVVDKVNNPLFAPIVIRNDTTELSIHIDLARDNNGKPIKGLIVYDHGVRRIRPGEEDSVARVKALLKTSINQTAEAQAHGMVRTEIEVAGGILTLSAFGQILMLGVGILVPVGGAAGVGGGVEAATGAAAAGGGAAGSGGAAASTTAVTTGIRVAPMVRIAEGLEQTSRIRVATEVVKEIVEETAQVVQRMSVRR